MIKTIRKPALALILFSALLRFAYAATTSNGITMVTPESGATFSPGGSVPVTLQIDSSLDPESAVIFVTGTGVPHLELNSLPFEGSIQIPDEFTGQIKLTAVVRTQSMELITGPSITINIVPSEDPVRIDVEPTKRLGFPEQSPLDEREVAVFGIYNNDIRRSISGSSYGTTYESSDPSVVAVDANGMLTAVAPGIAYITVANSGKTAITQVKVNDSSTGGFPSQDCTDKVVVTKSGFRRDQTTGRFVQLLKVTNSSALPLPRPINFVIRDLPEGVRLENSFGKAVVTSGIIARVDVKEKNFLPPGSSAEAKLEFSNRDGVPITYSRTLFCGRRP